MLRWEWFRIYFESGLVKILSGEQQWRNLTAMDKYYENGPLPTWIGWYVQHWPHAFHAATAAFTLIVELLVAWLVFFPKVVAAHRVHPHDSAADRNHPHRELRVSQLPRAVSGSSAC